MSDPLRLEMNGPSGSIEEGTGDPHPAELLARLLRAEAEAGQRSGTGIAAVDIPLPPHPTPIEPRPAEPRRLEAVPPAARALAAPAVDAQDPSTMQRTVQTIRSALPLLQKLLPLLDGNVLATLMALMAPSSQPQALPKPVDLKPVEGGLAELKTQQQELRGQVQAQETAMKKLAEQLETVREAAERNTREQDDLIDELRANSRKTNVVAFLAFVLLAASIAMNVVLYLEIHRLVP